MWCMIWKSSVSSDNFNKTACSKNEVFSNIYYFNNEKSLWKNLTIYIDRVNISGNPCEKRIPGKCFTKNVYKFSTTALL